MAISFMYIYVYGMLIKLIDISRDIHLIVPKARVGTLLLILISVVLTSSSYYFLPHQKEVD